MRRETAELKRALHEAEGALRASRAAQNTRQAVIAAHAEEEAEAGGRGEADGSSRGTGSHAPSAAQVAAAAAAASPSPRRSPGPTAATQQTTRRLKKQRDEARAELRELRWVGCPTVVPASAACQGGAVHCCHYSHHCRRCRRVV
eukprot:COSAG01_NODE_418_length_17279_cov_69.506228_6_plen_145_part_00